MKFRTFTALTLGLLAAGFLMASPAKADDLRAPQNAALRTDVATGEFEGAKSFIDSMAQRGINFLADPNISQEQRKGEFRKLLQSSFDTATIGKFALGTYWRTATPAQQGEYLKLFNSMIVEVYSKRFDEYKGQKVEVRGARADNTDVIVNSVIVPQGGGDQVSVDWRVRKKGGQYKIIDVIVEGVSMAVTQRSDFASVIQRGGGSVDVLINHLRGQG